MCPVCRRPAAHPPARDAPDHVHGPLSAVWPPGAVDPSLQVSLATGAAGVHLGPRAVALAADLNKHVGLTLRTTCRVLHRLGGLLVSPGGLVQRLARLATRLQPAYAASQGTIRAGPAVHSDETSWWVAGPGYWLWVFATPATTLYRVAAGRGRDVLTSTLGTDYAGVLVSDCLATYDGGPPVLRASPEGHRRADARGAQRPCHATAGPAARRDGAEGHAPAATCTQRHESFLDLVTAHARLLPAR